MNFRWGLLTLTATRAGLIQARFALRIPGKEKPQNQGGDEDESQDDQKPRQRRMKPLRQQQAGGVGPDSSDKRTVHIPFSQV